MLRTKDLQYRITHGEVKAVVVMAERIVNLMISIYMSNLLNSSLAVKKRIGFH